MGTTSWSWQLPRQHFNYHNALETTTQDEQVMNRLRVNAHVGTFIEGLFIIFIVK